MASTSWECGRTTFRYGGEGPARSSSPASVELSEISGSETFIHVHNGDLHWVVQQEGVHEYALHQSVEVFLDPARLYAFDTAGKLEAAPARVTDRS